MPSIDVPVDKLARRFYGLVGKDQVEDAPLLCVNGIVGRVHRVYVSLVALPRAVEVGSPQVGLVAVYLVVDLGIVIQHDIWSDADLVT